MFIGDEEKRRLLSLEDSILIVFYESVHLNRNFISTLTHAATECSPLTPTLSTNSNPSQQTSNSVATVATNVTSTNQASIAVNTNSSFDLNTSLDFNSNPNNMRLLNPLSLTIPLNNTTSSLSQNSPTTLALNNDLNSPQQANPPSNLLVIFMQSCSAILQETKMDTNNTYDTIKLFMLILVCISEDQYANSLLHDSNLLYSVFLYQAVGF